MMRIIIAQVTACIVFVACTNMSDVIADPLGVAGQPTYNLLGTVRDSDGIPVGGAYAQIVKGVYAALRSPTNPETSRSSV